MHLNPTHLLLLASLLTPACVIVDGGDEGADPSGADTGAAEEGSEGANGSEGAEGADATGEPGADVTPAEGLWQYEEIPGGTNECTFLEEPSNGFGEFEIVLTGGSSFTLRPGDATDPFTCTYGNGAIDCDERLTDTVEPEGYDAVGNILVAVEGTQHSEISITGTQIGHIDCVGSDCDDVAQALGVEFPCSFTVPFSASAL